MMKFILLNILLSVVSNMVAHAQTAHEISLRCKNGTVSEAVLLHVSDSVLVVDLSGQSWARRTIPPLDKISRIRIEEIKLVLIEAGFEPNYGTFIGIVIGTVSGFLMGSSIGERAGTGASGESKSRAAGGVFGASVGLVLGAMIGQEVGDDNSQSFHSLDPMLETDRQQLRESSVYPDSLPRFLR